jgi:predicted nucleotidyltransferase
VSRRKREPATLTTALPRIAGVLAGAGHRHALIGGIAVGVLVEPRATKDIDLVVSAQLKDVDALLLEAQKAGFEVHAEEVERLKLSHMTRVWTVDSEGEPVMINLLLDEHPFYDSLLDRSRSQKLADHEVRVASPEDLLLMKLLAARPQDLADAARLVDAYGADLEKGYLERWAQELDLESALREMLAGAPTRPVR